MSARDVRGFPRVTAAAVPAVSAEEMREVDRIMVEDLGIELIQMMENAGRCLAEVAIAVFGPRSALVLAGAGGNGGGGLAAARHLANRGVQTGAVLAKPHALGPVPARQRDILSRMGVAVTSEPAGADLVIDALIGYGLTGDPRERAAELIRWANGSGSPVLALDVPSGLDATSGEAGDPCVRATATLTLAAPKRGLFAAPDVVGRLFVGDISVPPSAFARLGHQTVPEFAESSILEIER